MWGASVESRDRTSWSRLGASAACATLMHAAIVMALPTSHVASITMATFDLPTVEALAFDLSKAGTAVGDGITTAAPSTAAEASPSDTQSPKATTRSARARMHAVPALTNPASAEPTDTTSDGDPADSASTGASGVLGESGALGDSASEGGGDIAGSSRGVGPVGTPSGARLLASRDPCAGYFPATSRVSRGHVKIAVDVDPHGSVIGSEVLEEAPTGAGLSQAARACAARLRFTAATTGEGQSIRSRTTLLLHFQRSE